MNFDIDLAKALSHLGHLVLAYALAFPLGWDREARARSAGIRTFPLVATASCGYMLAGIHFLGGSDAIARVIYGLMTGIGFIGGGAILKQGGTVSGTATAASIWNTGAIGMCVALDRFEIAGLLALLNFLTLRLGPALKRRAERRDPPD